MKPVAWGTLLLVALVGCKQGEKPEVQRARDAKARTPRVLAELALAEQHFSEDQSALAKATLLRKHGFTAQELKDSVRMWQSTPIGASRLASAIQSIMTPPTSSSSAQR